MFFMLLNSFNKHCCFSYFLPGYGFTFCVNQATQSGNWKYIHFVIKESCNRQIKHIRKAFAVSLQPNYK